MANIAGARRGGDLRGELEVLFQFQTWFPADDVQQSVRLASQTRAKLVYRSVLAACPVRILAERSTLVKMFYGLID